MMTQSHSKPPAWTEDRVRSELQSAIASLGKFPSLNELMAIGRNDLCYAVRNTGGFINWAEKLGMKRDFSDSDFGWQGERKVQAMLESRGFSVEYRDSVCCPYDLLINQSVRADVKTARKNTYSKRNNKCVTGWFYFLGKHPQSDVIILLQDDTADCYVLPWYVCTTTSMTISVSGGKYVSFRNNFSLLLEMAEKRKTERDRLSSLIV